MLIDFTVKNFRSIKDEQTLSMVASESTGDLLDNRIDTNNENFRLLPAAVIYGANASGKSNLIKALDQMKYLIVSSHKLSKDEPVYSYEPFRLDKTSQNDATSFEIEFIAEGIRYFYIVKFNLREILYEGLYFYPKKQKTKLYLREKGSPIDFGAQLRGHKKQIENILLSNQLFLSVAVNNNLNQLDSVYRFFSEKIVSSRFNSSLNPLDMFFSKIIYPSGYYIAEDNILKDEVVRYIQASDIVIQDIIIKEKDIEVDSLGSSSTISQEFDSFLRKTSKFETYVRHSINDSDNSYVDFRIEDESDGTQQLFNLAQVVIPVLKSGGVFLIDEIDRSLHTMLSEFIISEFNNPDRNPHGAQLIATTHDISLMKPENFRRDQIWFTQKEESGVTRLYSLDEYDKDKVRGNTPFYKWYLEGRFDAIPLINRSFLPERK